MPELSPLLEPSQPKLKEPQSNLLEPATKIISDLLEPATTNRSDLLEPVTPVQSDLLEPATPSDSSQSTIRDLGDVKTTSDLVTLFAAQRAKTKSFMGVEGAAPTTPFTPEGTPTTLKNWSRINPPEALPARSYMNEALAGLVRGSATAFVAPVKTMAILLNAPESVQQDIEDILAPTIRKNRPSRGDVIGKSANFAGGFFPAIVSGPIGFGTQAFNEIYDRTDNIPASVAGGIVASALSWIPIGNLISNSVGKKLIETYGETAVKRFLIRRAEGFTSSAIIGGGTATATELIARAAGASPEDINALEQTIGAYVGHEFFQMPRSIKDLTGPNPQKAQTELVKSRLFTPEEVQLIGNNSKIAGEATVRRTDGEKISIVKDPKTGKVDLVSQGMDSVPFDMQQKLQHNPVSIQYLRDEIAAGRASIWQDPSRLPPTPEEVTGLTTKLTSLRNKIISETKPQEYSDQNEPVSERALLADDLAKQITKLQNQPTKATVLQSMALENLSSKLKDSVKPVEEWRSKASTTSDTILSDGLDMRPVSRFRLPLTQSEDRGFFRPPDELTQNPRQQEKIAIAQLKTQKEISGLAESSKLSAVDKVGAFGMLDAEHQARIENILGKDPAVSEVEAQSKRRVSQGKAPDSRKIEALNAIDHAFEMIAKHTNEGSPQEIQDRLGKELENAPPEVQDLVGRITSGQDSWKSLVDKFAYEEYQRRLKTGEQGTAEGDYTKAEQRLKRSLVDVESGKTRNEIVKSLNGLTAEQAKPFIEAIRNVKSKTELDSLASTIEVARRIEQRKIGKTYLQRASAKLEGKMGQKQVEKLLQALTPDKKAQGREIVTESAVQLADKTVVSGNSHYEVTRDYVADKLKVPPQIAEGLIAKDDPRVIKLLAGANSNLFSTSYGRLVNRAEAADITIRAAKKPVSGPSEGATKPQEPFGRETGPTGTPKETKSLDGSTVEASKTRPDQVVQIDPKTGKTFVDQKILEKRLDKLTDDQHTALVNNVKEELRQGRIVQGLEDRYLKYSAKDDARTGTSAIEKSARIRSKFKDEIDTPIHLSGIAVYPTSTELFLYQMFGSDPNARVYKILHGNLIDGNIRDYQNRADVRRYIAQGAKKFLNIDPETAWGQQKFLRYLSKELGPKGVTRDEIMNAYLVGEDPGRQDSRTLGFTKKGQNYTHEELVAKLTPEDRKLADYLRSHLQDNPVWEKAMENYRLLKGYEVQRNNKHWMSSRDPLDQGPGKSFASIESSFSKDVDPLKDRQKGVNTPYHLKGAVSEFLRANDQMSLFAENGLQLHRAVEFFYNPKVTESMLAHWGQGNRSRVESYLSNIMGLIGIQPTPITKGINFLSTSFALSRVVLSPASAFKQASHLLTIAGDGTVKIRNLLQSLAEGAPVRSDVDKRMTESSGLAYERYHGNLLNDLAIMNENTTGPSNLKLLQHYGLVLQRVVDRAVMRTAWRASELEAQKSGLTGLSARTEATRLFNIVAGRDQPTANPLYSSELEVEAKRQPALRGVIMFAREQNRIFNVVSRRVGEAIQRPSVETYGRAGKAVLLGVVGNALAIASIDALRRKVYNQAQDAKTYAEDMINSTIGLWYMGAPAQVIAQTIMDPQHDHTDKLNKSPLVVMSKDAIKLLIAVGAASKAGEDQVKVGLSRGESKKDQALLKVADSAFSLTGGISGLPLWGVWNMAKGYYSWKHPDYKLMVEFEQKRQQLKANGQTDSLDYYELEQARKRINKIHQLHEKGLATEADSKREILEELKQVVR